MDWTPIFPEMNYEGANALASSDELIAEGRCALSILDTYLADSEATFSHERKDELLVAMRVLFPESDYAQRLFYNKEDNVCG
jgi:hypothetical protein